MAHMSCRSTAAGKKCPAGAHLSLSFILLRFRLKPARVLAVVRFLGKQVRGWLVVRFLLQLLSGPGARPCKIIAGARSAGSGVWVVPHASLWACPPG